MRWADAAGTILADQSFLPKPTDEDRAFVTEWARRRVSRLVATRVFPADRDDPYDAANEAARDVTSRLSAEVRRVHDAYLTIRKRVRANKGHLTLTMQKVAGIDRGRQVRTPTPAAGGSPLLFRTGLVRSAVYEATAEDMAWVDDDPVALARLQKLTDRIVRTVERMVHQIGDVPEYLRSGTVTATSWPDGYRRMFDYPPFSSDSPTPNPAAAKCWRQNPADHDELDFTPGTPAEGGPHMVSDAIDRLFTPSDDYFKRNLFFCDHTIMALHLEALDFADHALDAELEQIPPPLRERWIRIKTNIASGVFVGGAQESAAGGSLHFLHTRTRTANLRVGDHVLFWNHPVYPYVLPGGAWGLENALVVQTVPEILLQGHGTAPLTPDGMKARVVSALNSRVIDIRANLRNMLVLNEEARARGEPEPYPPEQYLGQYSAYHYTTYQTRQVRLVRRGAPPGYTGRGTIGTWWVAWECDPEEASIASDQSLDGQERREYIQNRQSVWLQMQSRPGQPDIAVGWFPLGAFPLGASEVAGWHRYRNPDAERDQLVPVIRPGA